MLFNIFQKKTCLNTSKNRTIISPPPSPPHRRRTYAATPISVAMLFSFCKSKNKNKNKLKTESFPSSKSHHHKHTHSSSISSANSTSSNFILPSTASTSTFNKHTASSSSSASSKSSISSLASLRQSILPSQSHLYSFSEISTATNGKPYSSSSSSTSWRCTLRHQAVLIIQRKFRRPIETSQLVDRLALICKSHHSSLVALKGASLSGGYIYLVYDYVPGASLSNCLRNAKNPNFTVLSSWISRIRVASDVAHGLDYVHNSTGLGFEFVHNHIKSSSVVVSEDSLSAKICHFGTAELCGEVDREGVEGRKGKEFGRSHSKVRKFEGTRGYMAPEFLTNGVPTQKGDVYAFGVVILELLSGMEALRHEVDEESGSFVRISVVEEARRAVESGGVRRWVDRRLRDSYPVDVVERLARLALDCVGDDPDRRPDMGKVVARVSQMFLESQDWLEKMGNVTDFTVSLAPR